MKKENEMPTYRGSKVKVWRTNSHSTPGKNYETIQWSNGELTCNCRGWIYPKNGNPRTCTHVQHAELQLSKMQPPIDLKGVGVNFTPILEEARRKKQAEYEANERLYVPPFKPAPFKKYKRLIRVAQ